MPALPIHYDCDPGQDDAIALLYALGSKLLDVQSVSVVGGNADMAQCARNALQILALAGRDDIPVYAGAEKPLLRPLYTLPEVFGPTGMAGAEDLPPPVRTPLQDDIAAVFSRAPRIWVATAPLTNPALALAAQPGLAETVERLVIMGGCVYPEPVHGRMGNFTPPGAAAEAEYNFALDPEAARAVLQSGIKDVTLIGLNVTRTVLYNTALGDRMRAAGTLCAAKAADILGTAGAEDREDYAALQAFPGDQVRAMHDVLAMACCERPDIFTFESLPLAIGADGQTLIAQTGCDHPAARVATAVDIATFTQTLLDNLGRLP